MPVQEGWAINFISEVRSDSGNLARWGKFYINVNVIDQPWTMGK